VDEQRRRISLGMKDSYTGSDGDIPLPSKQQPDEAKKENGFSDDTTLVSFPSSSLLGAQNMDVEGENEGFPVLAQAESRASIPPLEVSLDDIDLPDMGNLVGQDQERIDEADTIHERNTRQAKKKVKEERLIQFSHLSSSWSIFFKG
jgi:rRNA biogenesis protein RRP5